MWTRNSASLFHNHNGFISESAQRSQHSEPHSSPGEPMTLTFDLPCEEMVVNWTQEKFQETYRNAKSNPTMRKKAFCKFEFKAGQFLQISSNWHFFLTYDEDDGVGCFLSYHKLTHNTPTVVFAGFNISLLNRKTKEFISVVDDAQIGTDKYKKSGPCVWGLEKFRSIKELLSQGFLTVEEDILTLRLFVKFYGNATSSVELDKLVIPKSSETHMGSKWTTKLQNDLIGDLSKLLESGDGADVTFTISGNVTGDDAEPAKAKLKLNAHKGILMSRSPVFHRMFTTAMKEASDGQVNIEDISPEAMKLLLKFIYSGRIESDWGSVATELIYAAQKYELDSLKEYLDERIGSVLKIHNVREIRNGARLFNLQVALAATTKFIKENIDEFLEIV